MEFNINDYLYTPPMEEDKTKNVEYLDFNADLENKYKTDSSFSFRDRPDVSGFIKRIEDDEIVFDMFGDTYKMPPSQFDGMFYFNELSSPQNWYTKVKRNQTWDEQYYWR